MHSRSFKSPVAVTGTFRGRAFMYQRSLRTPCSLERANSRPHRPLYLSVPTTGGKEGLSYSSYQSTWRERRWWEEDKVGEEGDGSPCRARPQPRFPMPGSDHPFPPGHGVQREISTHSGGERFIERKKQEKRLKLETTCRPSHLPSGATQHSTGTTWC
ncbi:unnamed protein product [Pleuronectes platessa]|uniref:Uncharacterized protein n=1 Tax=Pleuronectes platessa TaxID=8262 RepID=A0A9N7TJ41_PLEPL|nr:unnamed protein product [Pleuronectes platessa]